MRDIDKMKSKTRALVDHSRSVGLMHATMEFRRNTETRIAGHDVFSFTNCSYLGFDTDPEAIKGAQDLLAAWGTHYCCARSRLSIGPLTELETRLTALFRTPAITFPSVTSTHAAVLPLLSSGILLGADDRQRPKFIFDKFAHSSMQVLKPILRQHADVVTIAHNDLVALEREIVAAAAFGQACVFLCDSVYSMGGVADLPALLALHDRYGIWLYIDDAHGTSIFGERGQGYVGSVVGNVWPERLFATFSLAKGFGCNGGGILLPDAGAEELVRYYGQTYSFSGPLDFAIVGAALKVVGFHEDGTVVRLQQELRRKVALLDHEMAPETPLPFSPIRMIHVGDEAAAIAVGEELLELGFYVPVVFYPVVPWGKAQLRLCITINHDDGVLLSLCRTLKKMGLKLDDPYNNSRNTSIAVNPGAQPRTGHDGLGPERSKES